MNRRTHIFIVLFGILFSVTALHGGLPVSGDDSKPQIGLAEGAAAPDFNANDQFGHKQTLKTLMAKNGVVLLFFRSADW